MLLLLLLLYGVVPPQQPTIDGYVNGSVIKVSHRSSSLSITCQSTGAKPAATFHWTRNGVQLFAPGGDSSSTSPGVVSIEYSRAPSGIGHAKLEDSTSVLTIEPREEDNEAYYSCLADNSALDQPLSVTVQLNVQRQYLDSLQLCGGVLHVG